MRDKSGVLPRINSHFPRMDYFPLIGAAVDEVQNNIQAPVPLIFFSALTAISVVSQGLYDVQKPNGQMVPVSLMLLTIANSGERKSTVDNIFLGPVREFQSECAGDFHGAVEEWESRLRVWDLKSKTIAKIIEKALVNGGCAAEIERRFIEHGADKPKRPRQFKILYDDCTPEALFLGLYENIPTAALISSEGGSILGGRAFNDLPKQNSIWSGDSITVDRRTSESYELGGARLTVSIMVQESAFKDYMDKSGERSRGSGLWARFLVCHPRTTQGTRLIKNSTMSWEHIGFFSTRLREILQGNISFLGCSVRDRQVVQFSSEAKELWLRAFNAIESEICGGGRFFELGDHASKLADNIVRVACLIHLFEGFEGDISRRTLEFAIDFCLWCSDEFYRLFLPPRQEELDADDLDDWLQRFRDDGIAWVEKNYVRQMCPNKLRSKSRLNGALNVLFERRRIDFFYRGKRLLVDLLPRRLV